MKRAGALILSIVALNFVASEGLACQPGLNKVGAKNIPITKSDNWMPQSGPVSLPVQIRPGTSVRPVNALYGTFAPATPVAPVETISTKKLSVEKYIWEAPSSKDKKIRAEISRVQIEHGVSSKEAAQVMFRHAKDYLSNAEYLKARNLTDELLKVHQAYEGIEGVSVEEIRAVRRTAMMNLRQPKVVRTNFYPRVKQTIAKPILKTESLGLRKI